MEVRLLTATQFTPKIGDVIWHIGVQLPTSIKEYVNTDDRGCSVGGVVVDKLPLVPPECWECALSSVTGTQYYLLFTTISIPATDKATASTKKFYYQPNVDFYEYHFKAIDKKTGKPFRERDPKRWDETVGERKFRGKAYPTKYYPTVYANFLKSSSTTTKSTADAIPRSLSAPPAVAKKSPPIPASSKAPAPTTIPALPPPTKKPTPPSTAKLPTKTSPKQPVARSLLAQFLDDDTVPMPPSKSNATAKPKVPPPKSPSTHAPPPKSAKVRPASDAVEKASAAKDIPKRRKLTTTKSTKSSRSSKSSTSTVLVGKAVPDPSDDGDDSADEDDDEPDLDEAGIEAIQDNEETDPSVTENDLKQNSGEEEDDDDDEEDDDVDEHEQRDAKKPSIPTNVPVQKVDSDEEDGDEAAAAALRIAKAKQPEEKKPEEKKLPTKTSSSNSDPVQRPRATKSLAAYGPVPTDAEFAAVESTDESDASPPLPGQSSQPTPSSSPSKPTTAAPSVSPAQLPTNVTVSIPVQPAPVQRIANAVHNDRPIAEQVVVAAGATITSQDITVNYDCDLHDASLLSVDSVMTMDDAELNSIIDAIELPPPPPQQIPVYQALLDIANGQNGVSLQPESMGIAQSLLALTTHGDVLQRVTTEQASTSTDINSVFYRCVFLGMAIAKGWRPSSVATTTGTTTTTSSSSTTTTPH
jgi:hypothetical protein